MEESEIIFYGIIVLFVILGIVILLNQPKCEKCGGKYKLDKIRTPLGINLTKRLVLNFYVGPKKYNVKWVCEKCGNIKNTKHGAPV